VKQLRQANLRGHSVAAVAQRSVRQTRNPKLLDQLREALRSRRYSQRTEQTYCYWVKRFVGYDISIVQELPGHKDVKITMIYTHVLNRGDKGVKNPVDDL